MAYENLKMVIAGLSGEIYLTRILKEGVMSDSRRIATEDCLRATTEWFMKNKRTMIQYQHETTKTPSLFYTDDPEKALAILEILKPDNEKSEKKEV